MPIAHFFGQREGGRETERQGEKILLTTTAYIEEIIFGYSEKVFYRLYFTAPGNSGGSTLLHQLTKEGWEMDGLSVSPPSLPIGVEKILTGTPTKASFN